MSIVNKAWNHYEALLQPQRGIGGASTEHSRMVRLAMNLAKTETTEGGFDWRLEPNFKVAGNNGENPFVIPSLNIQLCAMIDYKKWGQQNVVIGPMMQEAFADTELGKVPTNHLKFPYPAYWISIPDNEEIVCWGGTPFKKVGEMDIYGTGWHYVKGAYVIARDNGLLIHMWAPEPTDSTLREQLKNKFGYSPDPGSDWAHSWFTFQFHDDKDIEQALRDQYQNRGNEIHDPNPLKPGDNFWCDDMSINSSESISERVAESSVRLLRIIINSALYMTSPKADIDTLGSDKLARLTKEAEDLEELASRSNGRVSRGYKRRAERKRSKAERTRPPIIWIGPTIERKLRAATSSPRGVSESKRKGHVRKGHWHMFRTGRMKDDAGMKIPNEERGHVYHWIPPTWCGDLDTSYESQTHAFREV